ncbi:hypothetical protein I4I73_03355 [Pseudonocardia sp. KRD-184]|uniref:Uncharacterized protein n=1 Tax=Pseudonocardia oceani TaxID=2792013 RepID=A0ABS6UGZ9_9PSEU|nr:hypothetical protein [Pseudonocardia oceani]MBW0088252.1 hypothetical protein [Pseudonocardia oceani]MBW0095034.1 hypothetical protein [Pseudonocardia oceani]MBW0121113.1 hypothetical protein [Pseudonocardia oceani]MBW0131201.1 hypothetical protein [Pseudonocardia oceani]MBW0132632.1 hypothetical protein [Pseudonocardia oceani]
MSFTAIDYPSWACHLHSPPAEGKQWAPADQGYRTCSGCLNRLRSTLQDVANLYAALDATPMSGGEHGGRGAPGFGSKPAAALNVVAMRDRRTLPYALARDAAVYVFDPTADHNLQPGQLGPARGEYVEKRDVWYGADGRPHQESDHGVLSVPATLAGIAAGIAGMRDLPPPGGSVADLIRWLDAQLDWLTRQDWVAEPAGELHRLASQIRGVTDPRRRVGVCPNVIDEGPTTRVCKATLFAPVRGDSISCRVCKRVWPRSEWLRLGSMLKEAS